MGSPRWPAKAALWCPRSLSWLVCGPRSAAAAIPLGGRQRQGAPKHERLSWVGGGDTGPHQSPLPRRLHPPTHPSHIHAHRHRLPWHAALAPPQAQMDPAQFAAYQQQLMAQQAAHHAAMMDPATLQQYQQVGTGGWGWYCAGGAGQAGRRLRCARLCCMEGAVDSRGQACIGGCAVGRRGVWLCVGLVWCRTSRFP